jgi:hypothetical protein
LLSLSLLSPSSYSFSPSSIYFLFPLTWIFPWDERKRKKKSDVSRVNNKLWNKYFESIFDERIRWVNIFFSVNLSCGYWGRAVATKNCLSSCHVSCRFKSYTHSLFFTNTVWYFSLWFARNFKKKFFLSALNNTAWRMCANRADES